jgi:hypothetical protein
MKLEDVKKLDPLLRLAYWIKEREHVRLEKESGMAPPWTDDPILQQYRFTNVRRMDDKVSQWIWENWYKHNIDHENIVVAATLARFFNQPTALELITEHVFGKWNPRSIKKLLHAAKASGKTIFNAAYMTKGMDGILKVDMVVDVVCIPMRKKPPKIDTSSMQKTAEALMGCRCVGSFLAGQITADLRWAMSGTWYDRDSWAPMGPGSKRGMNRIFGRPIKTPTKPERFQAELEMVIDAMMRALPKPITSRLEAQDYQSCLCELDKYCRALFGDGRPKQKYPGV